MLLLLPLDFTTAAALAVLIGLGMGSEVDAVAYLSSRYFGTRRYGLIFGTLISVYGFAIGIGRLHEAGELITGVGIGDGLHGITGWHPAAWWLDR